MKNILYILFVLGIPFLFSLNGCSNKIRSFDSKPFNLYDESQEYNQHLLEILGQGECSVCDTSEILKVMSVAINRVNDKRFPNSLSEVVYADNQFHGMYRLDQDKDGNIMISDKVKWCAQYIMDNGSILSPDILGFLRINTIKTIRGKIWYNKIKDRIIFHDKYHSFYTL
jgi:hypothetical protein